MKKLKFWEKLAYASGDAGACIFIDTIYIFQLYFYTDVFGLKPAVAGAVMFFARFVGALCDIPAGLLSDRLRTRYGRFRPLVMALALPLAAVFSLLFLCPQLPDLWKSIYAVVSLTAFMIIFSFQNTPYSALGGVMHADEVERSSISSWRVVGSLIGGLVAMGLTLESVKFFGSDSPVSKVGWMLTSFVYALAALPMLVSSGLFVRERVQPASTEKLPLLKALPETLRIKGIGFILLAAAMYSFGGGCSGGSVAYYFGYVVTQDTVGIGLFSIVGQVVTSIACAVLTVPLSKRFGAAKVAAGSYLAAGVLSLCYLIMPPDATWGLLGFVAIRCALYAPAIALFWTVVAEIADRGGGRMTAVVFALACLVNKSMAALGSFVFGWGLGKVGYVANAPITASVEIFLRSMMAFAPFTGLAIAAWSMYRLRRHEAVAPCVCEREIV